MLFFLFLLCCSSTSSVKDNCPEGMVFISGGTFQSGVTTPIRPWHEESRSVVLESFCMDVYEYPNQLGELPMGRVTWNDAQAFCQQQDKRLCSSVEWERACRGKDGWQYSYGPTYQRSRCNTPITGGGPGKDPPPIAPSGKYSQCVSPEGVYDLNGSLSEWVSDPWNDFSEPFNARAKVDPKTWRTLRGGTMWSNTFYGQDCTSRHGHISSWKNIDDGFRCCANPR